MGWFHHTAPGERSDLPILTRAGLAHLYFVTIHPFEHGNGGIGRAFAEKALSEGLGEATLVALSYVINAKRRLYYDMLASANRQLEVTEWLVYFARTVLEAQAYSESLVEFIIAKAKFYARFKVQLNERQEKAIARVFKEEPSGFQGGLSAEKYMKVTGASRATATRDLSELVELGVLTRTGALKSTRYQINLPRVASLGHHQGPVSANDRPANKRLHHLGSSSSAGD